MHVHVTLHTVMLTCDRCGVAEEVRVCEPPCTVDEALQRGVDGWCKAHPACRVPRCTPGRVTST